MARFSSRPALVPAFRDKETGAVYVSPGYHDIRVLPGIEDIEDYDLDRLLLPHIEDGFVNAGTGEFLTREEAQDRYGAGETNELRQIGIE